MGGAFGSKNRYGVDYMIVRNITQQNARFITAIGCFWDRGDRGAADRA